MSEQVLIGQSAIQAKVCNIQSIARSLRPFLSDWIYLESYKHLRPVQTSKSTNMQVWTLLEGCGHHSLDCCLNRRIQGSLRVVRNRVSVNL